MSDKRIESSGTYREKWVLDILNGRSVLDAALDVHMTKTGSAERPPLEQTKDIMALKHVVKTWTNHGICDFDDAVLELIKVAIREASSAGFGAPAT